MENEDLKWYFNPQTGDVTQGPEGSWEERMGPYDSREEAAAALATAEARNKAAEDYDAEDDNWGVKPAWEK